MHGLSEGQRQSRVGQPHMQKMNGIDQQGPGKPSPILSLQRYIPDLLNMKFCVLKNPYRIGNGKGFPAWLALCHNVFKLFRLAEPKIAEPVANGGYIVIGHKKHSVIPKVVAALREELQSVIELHDPADTKDTIKRCLRKHREGMIRIDHRKVLRRQSGRLTQVTAPNSTLEKNWRIEEIKQPSPQGTSSMALQSKSSSHSSKYSIMALWTPRDVSPRGIEFSLGSLFMV